LFVDILKRKYKNVFLNKKNTLNSFVRFFFLSKNEKYFNRLSRSKQVHSSSFKSRVWFENDTLALSKFDVGYTKESLKTNFVKFCFQPSQFFVIGILGTHSYLHVQSLHMTHSFVVNSSLSISILCLSCFFLFVFLSIIP